MTKVRKTPQKGTDCTVLLNILNNILSENIYNTKEDILNETIKKYNTYFKHYSTNTKWNNLREDAVVVFQKNKFIKTLN